MVHANRPCAWLSGYAPASMIKYFGRIVEAAREGCSDIRRTDRSQRSHLCSNNKGSAEDSRSRQTPESGQRAANASITCSKTQCTNGCTDDNAGRLVLSRMATYFLAPLIDCGVLLTSDETGQLTGIHGRVTMALPGDRGLEMRMLQAPNCGGQWASAIVLCFPTAHAATELNCLETVCAQL
jgi:hypothetical protein